MISLAVVESFTSPWEAHVCRGLLESEDVPAFVFNEHHVWVNWRLSQALGGVRVCVPRGFEARARAVLNARDAGEYEEALCDEQGIAVLACRLCGSRRFRYRRDGVARALLVGMTFAFGVTFPPSIAALKCSDCGTVAPDAL